MDQSFDTLPGREFMAVARMRCTGMKGELMGRPQLETPACNS